MSTVTSTASGGRTAHPDEESSPTQTTSASVLEALPNWLKPGVARETHILVQVLLISLNSFLGYCGITGVFRPHFEVMFVLSLGLTACYYLFVTEIAKIHADEQRRKREYDQQNEERISKLRTTPGGSTAQTTCSSKHTKTE